MTANRLDGRCVFLSASFPNGERGRRFEPYEPPAIADAVTALARAVFAAGGRLVFGGHPTITPLVLLVAGEEAQQMTVDVYQSHWFDLEIPSETKRLVDLRYGVIHWTVAGDSVEDSLRRMRQEMLRQTDPVGGVFIGGMEGLFEEWTLFGELLQGTPRIFIGWMEGLFEEWTLFDELLQGRPRIPYASPGGAAAVLAGDADISEELQSRVHSQKYPALAQWTIELLSSA